MKSFKSTYIFAILVIVFSFYVYMFEFRASQKEEAKKEVAAQVFPFEQDEIEEIEIRSTVFERTIKLQKRESKWHMIEPKQDQADDAEMLALVSTLSVEKGEVIIEGEEIDQKEFGLDQPLGEIFVRGNGKVESIIVARESSYDGKMYIQPTGKNVLKLVDTGVTDILSRQPDQLRDKVVLRARLGDVKRAEYLYKGKAVFTILDENGVWKLKGDRSRLAPSQVKEFLGNVEDLRVDKFVVDTPTEKDINKFSLGNPEHQFVVLNGERTLKIGVSGEKDGKAFLSTTEQSPIMSLPWSRVKKLLVDPENFKDRAAPFDFESEQIREIRYLGSNQKIEIERDGSEWKLKNPIDGKTLNGEKVRSFISSVKALRAEKFLRQEPSDTLQQASNRVVLNGKEGVSVLELAWGREFLETENDVEVKYVRVQTSRAPEPVGVLASEFEHILEPGFVEPKKKDIK